MAGGRRCEPFFLAAGNQTGNQHGTNQDIESDYCRLLRQVTTADHRAYSGSTTTRKPIR